MAIQIAGVVGQQSNSDGASNSLRTGKQGDGVISELHGRFYESNYRNNVYYAVNTAAQALSVASSTYTGLVVQNPVGSGKNLAILEVIWINSVAPTGVGSIVLGWGGTTTAGVPVALTTGNSSGPLGSAAVIGSTTASVAKVGASCTWSVNGAATAPTILRPLIGIGWVTATAQSHIAYKDEMAGSLIVPPGVQVGVEAITSAITGFAYISWEEVAI